VFSVGNLKKKRGIRFVVSFVFWLFGKMMVNVSPYDEHPRPSQQWISKQCALILNRLPIPTAENKGALFAI
jgi:hypothetical protein